MSTSRGKFAVVSVSLPRDLVKRANALHPKKAAQSRYYQHADGLSRFSRAQTTASAITRRTITGARTARRKRNASC